MKQEPILVRCEPMEYQKFANGIVSGITSTIAVTIALVLLVLLLS